MKGLKVRINATPDNKGNLRGANLELHEYQGKTTPRVKINGDRLQIGTASEAAAAAQQNGTAPTPAPTGNGGNGYGASPGTLTHYLSGVGRAYRYARDVLGITDEQAAIAFSNTVGIALSSGKLVLDDEPEPSTSDQPLPF
jgi:hypothetical protein